MKKYTKLCCLSLAFLFIFASCKTGNNPDSTQSTFPEVSETRATEINIENMLTEIPYDVSFPEQAGLVSNNQFYRIVKYENPPKRDIGTVEIFHQRGCIDGKLVYVYCLGKNSQTYAVDFKYGLMNENFLMITENDYDKVHPFDDGCAVVMINDLYGVVNEEGSLILECKYDNAPEIGLDIIRVEISRDGSNKKYEYFDKEDGELLFAVDRIYNVTTHMFESYIVKKDGSSILVANVPGWDDEPIHSFVEGETDLWGYMDNDGNILTEPIFQETYPFKGGRAVVKLDNKYGYVNEYGEIIIDAEYDMAYEFSEGMARVYKGRRYGYIDESGTLVIDCEYVMAGDFGDGLAAVRSFSGEYNYINTNGEIVISGDFTDAGTFSHGYAPVQEMAKGRYHYIDTRGNIAFNSMNFDSAEEFNEDGYALAIQRVTIYFENLELGGTDWNITTDDVYLIYVKPVQ